MTESKKKFTFSPRLLKETELSKRANILEEKKEIVEAGKKAVAQAVDQKALDISYTIKEDLEALQRFGINALNQNVEDVKHLTPRERKFALQIEARIHKNLLKLREIGGWTSR